MARDFVRTTRTRSFQMLWDPSFESWRALGVPGQPSAMLLTPDGDKVLRTWFGPFDEAEVLRLTKAPEP